MNTIQSLLTEAKLYLKLQKDYISLEITYKLIVLSYTMILLFILITLSLITLFFLAFTLAHILKPHVGSFIYSYALISGGIILLGGCIYLFRNQLIKQPLSHFLANLLLNKN